MMKLKKAKHGKNVSKKQKPIAFIIGTDGLLDLSLTKSRKKSQDPNYFKTPLQ